MSFEKSEKYKEFITSILKYSHQKDGCDNPEFHRSEIKISDDKANNDNLSDSEREFNTEEI
jgi:hypothetical protein